LVREMRSGCHRDAKLISDKGLSHKVESGVADVTILG
jgi:hypothetical protein